MRPLLFLLLGVGILSAETIGQLIDKSLHNHRSLKAIEQRLDASDSAIARTRNFENPTVSLTINDIQFDDIGDRTLEPMQWTAIKAKQKFPWFGKRDARGKYERAKKTLVFRSLEAAQVRLAEEIRKTVYTIKEIDGRLAILAKYRKVTQENIDLNTAYTATQRDRHSGIVSAELTLSAIKIRIEKLQSIRESQRAKLEYLVQGKIGSVKASLKIHPPRSLGSYLRSVERNREYHIKLAKREIAEADSAVKSLEEYADPYVELGYFERQEHPDFGSISIGISAPIYGTERLDSEAARMQALSARSEAIDYRLKLRSEIKGIYAQLKESWRIYKIIKEESLPNIEHMFDLNSASIQSGGDLFTTIDILRQKLTLDEQLVAAKANYLRTEAKLKSLTGVIK